jgi:hypothetical protein
MSEPLLTVAELRASMGQKNISPAPDDLAYELAIEAASEAVRSYTGMRFELAEKPYSFEDRLFRYDGTGILDIDEAMDIQSVTVVSTTPGSSWEIEQGMWLGFPINKPVKFWLELPPGLSGMSPLMGFKRNLDRLYPKYQYTTATVRVNAIWGWPAIPADVKQAIAWTAASAAAGDSMLYQQESIEGYSRTRMIDEFGGAIPGRAEALLQAYIVPRV